MKEVENELERISRGIAEDCAWGEFAALQFPAEEQVCDLITVG